MCTSQEEEEQLLAGPKEESRTTEAMRKFVQEEEERFFLEKGPLRAKVQAIGRDSLSSDVLLVFVVILHVCVICGGSYF